ncbi:hypothetical protein [Thiohalophilus sp.]|uniref:hypothetical protein n=1 Tax=Thiohalophilus sp. TaxID=3028392 RepID=UPI002ACEA987|nr:hypothetical protein [Thiohalophilus sp.]MDZ7805104.1 hypothetical protein [Thiohalophilus sp.]
MDMNKASKNPITPGNNSGFSAIKVVIGFFIAIIVIAISIVVFYEGRKAYWDYRVQEMCEEEGGVKVYESIYLPKNKFNELRAAIFYNQSRERAWRIISLYH